ncbi:hypothetical protein [Quadrisphaera sp. DSM 44207]|uniref:hypothetical protein n=1 Tax=Quadrisphaera sp. DSM 44207 TaxID=1881057 RepID=UPI00115F9749|nr:hypothetical protein [Quadrisphaera sp. DSM 44207]
MPIVFTAAWARQASGHDSSGLWPIGAILLGTSMVIGAPLLTRIGGLVRTRHDRSRSADEAGPAAPAT